MVIFGYAGRYFKVKVFSQSLDRHWLLDYTLGTKDFYKVILTNALDLLFISLEGNNR
jgi:hypothetical protein